MAMVKGGAVLPEARLQFFIYLQIGTRVMQMLVAYLHAPASAFAPSHRVLLLVLCFCCLGGGEMEGAGTHWPLGDRHRAKAG